MDGEGSKFESLRNGLDAIRVKENNPIDALIADTCIALGYTLVTHDRDLKTVAHDHGCSIIDLVAK